MKNFLKLIFKKKHRKATITFLILGVILTVLAFVVGISDNLPGIALWYLGIVALIMAFAHTWRRIKNFRNLLIVSIIGFPVFVVLHNVMYGLAELAENIYLVNILLSGLDVLFFLLAIIVCPPGIVVGILGIVVLFQKQKSRNKEKINNNLPKK